MWDKFGRKNEQDVEYQIRWCLGYKEIAIIEQFCANDCVLKMSYGEEYQIRWCLGNKKDCNYQAILSKHKLASKTYHEINMLS